ncbi:MAG TPA: hypothetical protein VIG99_11695 [Myxococcaceae bacterium]
MQRKLSRAWRRWLAENLLLGVKSRTVERALVKAGLNAPAARAAVDAVVGDPCFRGAFRATAMQRKLEGLMDAYGDLYRQAPSPGEVERRDALGARELLQKYLLRSRPVIARGALAPLAASGELALRDPRPWPGGRRPSRMRRATTDLLVYQVIGGRALTLVPWCDFLAVAGRTRASTPERHLRLRAALQADDLLLIPVGWWYRQEGGAAGAAICYRAGEAKAAGITWREARALFATAPPRARP